MSGTSPAVFDYKFWATVYPSLAVSVSEPQAQEYFNLASSLYVDNTACSPIPMLDGNGNPLRIKILGMAVSHIATILASLNGQAPNPLVGRIGNASQGSVSVATDFPSTPDAAWWNQSPYGAMAYAAMAPFRRATYFPGPRGYGYFGRGGGAFAWR